MNYYIVLFYDDKSIINTFCSPNFTLIIDRIIKYSRSYTEYKIFCINDAKCLVSGKDLKLIGDIKYV